MLYKWHSVIISVLINSVPLSVTRISRKIRSVKSFFNFFKLSLMFSGPFKIILLSEDFIERS